MRNKLEESELYGSIQASGDVATLLRAIKQISHQIEDSACIYDAIDELQRQLNTYRQSPNGDNATQLTKFKDLIDVLDHAGLDIFANPCLIAYEKNIDKAADIPLASDKE